MYIGAIDIGGTTIKAAVIDEQGNLTERQTVLTEAARGGEYVLGKIRDICDAWTKEIKLDGIAISTAGQVDPKRGEIIFATDTIPGYTGMKVCERMMEYVNLPVSIENDVNCTALGEHWMGAAKGVNDFLTVALGTGIGGALFLNGDLYRGARFSGGEIGHMVLYPGGKPCTCLQSGCYERYASSAALSEIVKRKFGDIELPVFFNYIRAGNPEAQEVFANWIEDLTIGLASLVHMLNPSTIVIGGGVSEQGALLQDAIQQALEMKLMPNHKKRLKVVLAEKGNDSNLLGAVAHFFNQYPF